MIRLTKFLTIPMIFQITELCKKSKFLIIVLLARSNQKKVSLVYKIILEV